MWDTSQSQINSVKIQLNVGAKDIKLFNLVLAFEWAVSTLSIEEIKETSAKRNQKKKILSLEEKFIRSWSKMELANIIKHGLGIPKFLGTFLLKDLRSLNVVKNDVGFIIIYNHHAVAVYICENTIDIMDPLGFQSSEAFQPICTFLANHLPGKILRIASRIQSDFSDKCAKFALVFLYLRCTGYSFQSALQLYNLDYVKNDEKVDALFKSFFQL